MLGGGGGGSICLFCGSRDSISANQLAAPFLLVRGCVSAIQVLNFVRVAVQSHKVNLVSMDRNVGDDLLLYELPVDSKLQEFTISISGENPHISILDPQGRPNQLRYLCVLLAGFNLWFRPIKCQQFMW